MNRSSTFIVIFSCLWVTLVGCIWIKSSSDFRKSHQKKYSIGLLIMATGKYVQFVPRLIESAQKYFCTNNHVTYFVFTQGDMPAMQNVIKVPQDQMGWPYDTMMRFHVYYKNKELFKDLDYVYACDADMLFVGPVGDEILGERVATLHPNYIFEPKPYDTNPLSTACIHRGEGKIYTAGAFYGGTREEFLKLINTAKTNVDIDLSRGVIAAVNDESHLNRYFIDHEPTVVLSPSYCHFESWDSPYERKLIAFDKPDHNKNIKRKMLQFDPMSYYQKILKEEVVHHLKENRSFDGYTKV